MLCRYHKNADGTAGFMSPLTCVTKAGWGYNGRNSYKCDKGTYNSKDSYSNCKPCTFGLTTAGVGAGVKESDCGIAPGHGYEFTAFYNTTVVECPIGKHFLPIAYQPVYLCQAVFQHQQESCMADASWSSKERFTLLWGGGYGHFANR